MFYDLDRCIQCGTHVSPGSWWSDDFRVPLCSDICYKATVNSLIKKFLDNNTDEDKEEIKKDEQRLKESLAYRESLYRTYNLEFQDYETLEYQNKVQQEYDQKIREQYEWEAKVKQWIERGKARIKEKEAQALAEATKKAKEVFFSDWHAKMTEKVDKEYARTHPPEPPKAILSEISEAHWYSHALLLAQTRMGKTNVIRWRLQQLIPHVAQGKASVILMEPKGVLTDEVLRMASLPRDRVVILDPMDTRVSVNIFDKGDGSDYAVQESIARVSRVLNTITMTLTPFQQDCLTFALRALHCTESQGSMRSLTQILRKGIKDLQLRDVPYAVQEFFTHDFKAGDGSAQQVISRLNSLLANPVMEALFAADRTTFDMFKEIQAGKLIVINASAGDAIYSRFWIEQVASCITPRFKIPYEKRIPTQFIIDEAQTWLSEDLHFAGILDKAAEARIGMLIALHHMGQIKDVQVRGSIYTNTATKFAARTSEDIHALCRSMNCEPEFLSTLAQYEFGYFGPGMTKAIKVKFPLVEFDKMAQMTAPEYQAMRAANRKRYSYVRDQFTDASKKVETQEAPTREAPKAGMMSPIVPQQKPVQPPSPRPFKKEPVDDWE